MFNSLGHGAAQSFQGFSKVLIVAIESSISLAMNSQSMVDFHTSNPNAEENELTHYLQKKLVEIRETQQIFNGNVFNMPQRDAAIENFNGVHPNKRPDLVFYLNTSHSLQNAWFCECKIIESLDFVRDRTNTTKTVANYVTKGVQRFQDGDYAWAMPHAQMIAYVRGYTPETMAPNTQLIKRLGNPPLKQDGGVVITKHTRSFTLPNGEQASSITLRHLWFYI